MPFYKEYGREGNGIIMWTDDWVVTDMKPEPIVERKWNRGHDTTVEKHTPVNYEELTEEEMVCAIIELYTQTSCHAERSERIEVREDMRDMLEEIEEFLEILHEDLIYMVDDLKARFENRHAIVSVYIYDGLVFEVVASEEITRALHEYIEVVSEDNDVSVILA